jgi:hypothetical protein
MFGTYESSSTPSNRCSALTNRAAHRRIDARRLRIEQHTVESMLGAYE